MRLWTKNTCPPRSSSRAIPSSISPSSHGSTKVSTGERSRGGVCDQRHVAQAGERQVQRARDRRGGEREHVRLELELLEPLLVLHAEAMLLVHDDETEIGEVDVGAQQPVRADDDVDLLLGDLDERLAPAPSRSESAIASRTSRGSRRDARRRCAPCWSARIVVGTSTATWRPDCTALNAARTAISVLP